MKFTILINSSNQVVNIPIKKQFTKLFLLNGIHYKPNNNSKNLIINIEECDNENIYVYSDTLYNYSFNYIQNGANTSEYREYKNNCVNFKNERLEKLTFNIKDSTGNDISGLELSSTYYLLLEFELI